MRRRAGQTEVKTAVKRTSLTTISLALALSVTWLLWSGHLEPFILALGLGSVLFTLILSGRMNIVDEESAPAHLGVRPFTSYAPWLVKEIVVANIDVTRRLLRWKIPLQRNMVHVNAHQRSELGRVIFANSITLTPGTVSVKVNGDKILVHSISLAESEEDMSGEMNQRVCDLESQS